MNYIWSFDLSLSNSGVAIFDDKGNPVYVFSIATDSRQEHKDRLKTIGDALMNVRQIYPTNFIVLEAGFSRFTKSTTALYRVQGLILYLFADAEQKFYAPSTIKKMVCGNGKADKEQVQNKVLEYWPQLKFSNQDESDAVSVGLCWMLDKRK